MRRDAKVDANQAEIVEALRAVGCIVHCTHRLGDGFPDLTVWSSFTELIHLIEIKSPGGELTDFECKFHIEWIDAIKNRQLHIVRTIDEALDAVGAFPF